MLQFRTQTLRQTLGRMPMLRALPPLVAGILLADLFSWPLWFCGGGFLLAAAVALWGRFRGVAVAAAILLFGMTVSELGRRETPPARVVGEYEIVVREHLAERDSTFTLGARIRAMRSGDNWVAAAGNLVLRCDSSVSLQVGERAVVRGKIYPFYEGGYGRLMTRRGYVGTLYLSEAGVSARSPGGFSLRNAVAALHEGAVERLDRLGLAPDEQALVNAMTAGDRRSLSPRLRAAYARSGTSHLLAVSGLHVGIVFMLANLLLWWLPLFRRGHVWRNVAVIVLIWLYAAVTGFPPSVVRAAAMFSVLQFAFASSSAYVGMNTLAGVALVMLTFNTDYLFDISFQLSFVAVAGIIAWGVPLGRALRSRWRAVDAVTGVLVVGLTAAAVTAPLICYTFGQVSIVGLALNPVVILISNIVVGGAALWLLVPVGAPVFSWVIGKAAWLQNFLVEWAAGMPGAALDVRLSGWACLGCYAAMVAATLALWSAERKKSVTLPAE